MRDAATVLEIATGLGPAARAARSVGGAPARLDTLRGHVRGARSRPQLGSLNGHADHLAAAELAHILRGASELDYNSESSAPRGSGRARRAGGPTSVERDARPRGNPRRPADRDRRDTKLRGGRTAGIGPRAPSQLRRGDRRRLGSVAASIQNRTSRRARRFIDRRLARRIRVLLRVQARLARATRGPAVQRGLGRARNALAELARGEFAFFLDADNAIYPSALSRLTEALDADPGALFAYGMIEVERPASQLVESASDRGSRPACGRATTSTRWRCSAAGR